MNYHILDSILNRWAKKHSLHVYTIYKGEAVRSIEVVSPAGKRFQIWIDDPSSNGKTEIHAWDYRKRRCSFDTDLSSFESYLERAYSEVRRWF